MQILFSCSCNELVIYEFLSILHSDWPLLNALLNCASGATWVSFHHGGGVGIGFSQHAGLVICCDGTPAAAKRIERVLWNDPASGVMRHADAGYKEAIDCAKEKNLQINKINDITFVNAAVTDFADSLGYCEYKIPLSIQGVKPKPSQALIQGTKAHHEKEQYEAEHVELEPVTITEIKDESQDIEFARENIYSTLAIPNSLLTNPM